MLSSLAIALTIWLGLAGPSAASDVCLAPISGGTTAHASDCLFILRAAVSLEACEPVCQCDLAGSQDVTSVDALVCLTATVTSHCALPCACPDGLPTPHEPDPIGTCSDSEASCATDIGCRDLCATDCETVYQDCFDGCTDHYRPCYQACDSGDEACIRLCRLREHGCQIHCYRDYEDCGEPCPFVTCRSAYEGPRFEDTGLTVIDHANLLEWEKKTVANVLDRYSWTAFEDCTDADGSLFTDFFATLNDPQAPGGCYAGHCDWRLPRLSKDRETGDRAEFETLNYLSPCPINTSGYCMHAALGPVSLKAHWSGTVEQQHGFARTATFDYELFFSTLHFDHLAPARAVRDYDPQADR